jgi:hypothetical protein
MSSFFKSASAFSCRFTFLFKSDDDFSKEVKSFLNSVTPEEAAEVYSFISVKVSVITVTPFDISVNFSSATLIRFEKD